MYLTVHLNCLEPKAKIKYIKHILKVSDGGNGQTERLSICSDGEERIRISFGKRGRRQKKR